MLSRIFLSRLLQGVMLANRFRAATLMESDQYRECFEHPLYFVCQMYMKGWNIRDIYKREPAEEPQESS